MGKIGKLQKTTRHKKLKKTFDSSNDKKDLAIGHSRTKLHNLPVNDEDLDKQEIPRKVRDIMKSQMDLKNKQPKKKAKKKFKKSVDATMKIEKGMTKPLAKVPRFVQGKYEKDRNFISRVELETQRVLMKSQIEMKYKIKNTETSKNQTQIPVKKKTSDRKREKDKERKMKKAQAVKEKKMDRAGDFSSFRDDVAFGEVAMAPPSLTARPRKVTKDDEKPRPGKRSLLLKDMMEPPEKKQASSNSSVNQTDSFGRPKPKSQAQRQAGQTVKRKFLSPAQRQITDFQRQNAINLYRKMKDTNIKQPR